MPNPNVTIRHTRIAIHLVMAGAVRDIEAAFAPGDPAGDAMVLAAFDEAAKELNEWALNTDARSAEAMVEEMQAMLGQEPYPTAVAELLTRYNLLP